MNSNFSGETIEGEFTEVSSSNDRLKKFGEGYNDFGVAAIKGIAKSLALCATIATGVAVGNIASDPDRDIMDIPKDVSSWLDKHPELDSWKLTKGKSESEETVAFNLEQ